MKKILFLSLSALACSTLIALPIASDANASDTQLLLAADDGGSHGAGGKGQGNGGKGGPGKGQAGQGAGGNHGGTAGSADDGSGPKGKMGQSGMEGRPKWAGQELADIGRLNVIKSPDSVLQRAIDNVEEYDAAIYGKTVSQFISSLTSLDQIIDSPVTNVAILKEYWTDGTVSLPDVTPSSYVDFSAILIGTAVDKETVVTKEIVEALATIVGEDMTDAIAQQIADKADDVREKVVEVHDAS